MRRALLILGIVVAGSLLLALTLPFLININQFRPQIEAELTRSLGRDVKIGAMNLNILSGTVTATDVSVADDPAFSKTPFLSTQALTLSVDLWQVLFSRRLSVNGMTLDAPVTDLIEVPSGTWNFSSFGARAATGTQTSGSGASPGSGNLAFSVKSLKINKARVSLTQGKTTPRILDNVSIEITDFAPGVMFPFSLSAKIPGGGTVALDGKAGPIGPLDAASTPFNATVKVTNLNLAASGAVPQSSGINGAVALDAMASFNGHALDMTGNLKAEKLKLAPKAAVVSDPLLLAFALTDDLAQHTGQISKGDIVIGGVKASLTGTWTTAGETPVLKMNLSAPAVTMAALARLLPALGVILPVGSAPEGGTATANLALSGPASALVITGPVSLHNTRLKGFDLGTKLSPIEKLAGLRAAPDTEIQTLTANVRLAPAGTSIQNIHLVLPAVGEVTGAGTIANDHALDFRMRAALRTSALVSALAPSNIPFIIAGTTSNPEFRPEVGQLATAEVVRGVSGLKVGGVDAGKVADGVLKGLFGGKKKQ
jgi:AsmA protein